MHLFQQRPHDHRADSGVRAVRQLKPRLGAKSFCRVELHDGTSMDFAYTCSKRDHGLNFDEIRNLIFTYLAVTGIDHRRNSDGSINTIQ